MAIPQEGTYKLNVAQLRNPRTDINMPGRWRFTIGESRGTKSNDLAPDIDVTFNGDKISLTMPTGESYVIDPASIAVSDRDPGTIFVQDLESGSWWVFSVADLLTMELRMTFDYAPPAGTTDPMRGKATMGEWRPNGSYINYVNGKNTSHVDFGPPECFLPGTLIETEEGLKPVEQIRLGDRVLTLWGRYRQYLPVIWVGSKPVRVHPDLSPDMAGYPVIIKAGAISDHVPRRDLRVTSEHCIALENRLIPVRMLVNGASIFYDMTVTSYEVHHVETARHAIILTEGLGVETYLDTGNRNRFERHVGITPALNRTPQTKYMPVLPIGMALPEMKRLWTRIAQRAATRSAPPRRAGKPGRRRPSPRFKILSKSGAAYRLTQIAPNIFKARLPASETKIAFESPSFRFCDLHGPYHDDRRRLGTLVEGIDITTDVKAGGKKRDVAFERGAGWIGPQASWPCWTNGHGELHLEPPENGGQMHMVVRVNADVLKPV